VRSFFNSKNRKRRKKMKVLIGTKNPGKIEGAKRALENYYKDVEIVGVKAESNVSEQPVGLETYMGALNRTNNLIKYAKENNIDADLFMSVESGLTKELGFWAITNIAVIKNNKGELGVGSSASFPVPKKYVESIKAETLGTVMDSIFNESDLRSSTGGIGLLTKEVLTRIDLTKEAFVMALTPFLNENWKDDTADFEIE
jgi:inosine/xanthosine triphosphatase